MAQIVYDASDAEGVEPTTAQREKRAPVHVGTYLLSPEAFRIASFVLFGVMILICLILTRAFADVPETTEIVRAFGYNNVCVYLDYAPASQIAPTLWILFLYPWTTYSLSWMARCWSRVQPHGPVSLRTYRVLQACTAFELVCAIHFIQCFANKPHDMPYPLGLKMHTYPFTLLIVALWLMSFKNVWWFTVHEELESRARKLGAWAFELLYFVVSALKVLIHINFFLDSAFWPSDQAVGFGQAVDAAFMLMGACLVPLATWLGQYRQGDRVQADIHAIHVIDGEYDLRGRRRIAIGVA